MTSMENTSRSITDDVSLEPLLTNFSVTGQHHQRDLLKLGIEYLEKSGYPLVPTWILIVYFACVNLTGIILNISICISYFCKKKKKGIYTLIVQMAISDLITLTIVAIPELWSHHSGTWMFGTTICRLYSSFEVFAGTSNIYFLVAVNLHVLASINLMIRYPGTCNDFEGELLEDVTEMKSSQHNLVSRASTLSSNGQTESPTRTKKPSVSVLLPLIFVWILSAALSMPQIPLSRVVDSKSGISICTFLEGYHLTSMRAMLAVFQLFIPFVILSATSAVIIFTIFRMPTKDASLRFLKTSLFLCSLFLLFSVPRFALASLHGPWAENKDSGQDLFKSPPLNYDITPISVPIALSFLHFLTPVLKPLGYLYFIKKSTKTLSLGGGKRQHRSPQIQ